MLPLAIGPQPMTARLSVSDGAGRRPRVAPMLNAPPHAQIAASALASMNSLLVFM
jgi:hypothetical protein